MTLTLTPWPKINRVPPLIIHNLHVKFESDRAKSVFCIVSTRQSATDALMHGLTHSLTQSQTNGSITISPPTLLRGDNKYSEGWNTQSRIFMTESAPWVGIFIIPLTTHQYKVANTFLSGDTCTTVRGTTVTSDFKNHLFKYYLYKNCLI